MTHSSRHMLKYEVTNMKDNYSEVVALCGAWWRDAEFYEETKIPYRPDYTQFKALEDAGMLVGIIGRDEEGKAASCFIAALTPFIFNPDVVQAAEVVWHIREDQRSFRNLGQLLGEVEELLTSKGVHLWNLALPPANVKTGKALERFGYFKQDTMYMRYKDGKG